MSIKEKTIDELEQMSYADIAYEILKETKKKKTTPVLFKEVCDLLEIGEDAMFEMIGDFYTALTTDKRFILIDTKWDLKEFHKVKLIVDEDEEDEEESSEEDEEEIEGTEDDAVIPSDEDYDDDLDEDMEDLDDLSIVSEDELEEE